MIQLFTSIDASNILGYGGNWAQNGFPQDAERGALGLSYNYVWSDI